MTREEAITVLKGLSDNPLFSNQHRAAFNIAIHDVTQYHDWNINNLILINKDNYELPEQEPRKGHWIKTPKAVMGEGYMWYCDKCNHEVYQDSSRSYPSENFCPNCGSDNREVEE